MIANELRIGNLYIDVCGSISKWSANSFSHYEQAKVNISELQPVPLTEERLLKLGFERDLELEKLEGSIYKQYIIGQITTNNFYRVCWHEKGKFTFSYRGTPIYKPKYVHKLQNLYFALTDKELKTI